VPCRGERDLPRRDRAPAGLDALDAAALQKMAEAGDEPTPAMMRGIKGITASDDEVTIEFKK